MHGARTGDGGRLAGGGPVRWEESIGGNGGRYRHASTVRRDSVPTARPSALAPRYAAAAAAVPVLSRPLQLCPVGLRFLRRCVESYGCM